MVKSTKELAREFGIEDEDIDRTCSMCGGELYDLGSLGRKKWYRCRNCGMDFSD